MTERDVLGQDLDAFLANHAPPPLAGIVGALAAAAIAVAGLIARGPLGADRDGPLGAPAAGDARKAVKRFAEDSFADALRATSARALLTEDREAPSALDPHGLFLVAIDPLEGASDVDVNTTTGAIFSILDAGEGRGATNEDFLAPGHRQRAAGVFVHGPSACLIFTLGSGTHVATLDPSTRAFRVTAFHVLIPEGKPEFAIDASNARFWPGPVRAYIEDCLMGEAGPRGKNFSMRWVGSMAADLYRVLRRGGACLYPDDARAGYAQGKSRLLFQANPIALLVEQAGGLAIDGVNRVLDLPLKSTHARAPLIFGSTEKIERIRSYFVDGHRSAARAPLFGKRGLLRG